MCNANRLYFAVNRKAFAGLVQAGVPISAIARLVGKSQPTVRKYLEELKLIAPRKRAPVRDDTALVRSIGDALKLIGSRLTVPN